MLQKETTLSFNSNYSTLVTDLTASLESLAPGGLWEDWQYLKDSSHGILQLGLPTPPCRRNKIKWKKVTGIALIKPNLQLIGNISKLLEEKQLKTPWLEKGIVTSLSFPFYSLAPFARRNRLAITEMKDHQDLHQVGDKCTSSQETVVDKPG